MSLALGFWSASVVLVVTALVRFKKIGHIDSGYRKLTNWGYLIMGLAGATVLFAGYFV